MIGRIILAAVLLAPAPALAQSDTGTRLGGHPAQVPNRGTMPDAARARIVTEGYAACVAKRDPMRVARVLDAPLDAPDTLMRDLPQDNFDACLSGGNEMAQLRFSWAVLRGALYVERVARTVRDLTAETVALHPLTFGDGTGNPARVAIVRFGDCVVRQDPVTALSYVRAGATLGMETKALTTLKPALAACINSGDKVELSRSSIKAALAEAIYRTLRAPAVAKAGTN